MKYSSFSDRSVEGISLLNNKLRIIFQVKKRFLSVPTLNSQIIEIGYSLSNMTKMTKSKIISIVKSKSLLTSLMAMSTSLHLIEIR